MGNLISSEEPSADLPENAVLPQKMAQEPKRLKKPLATTLPDILRKKGKLDEKLEKKNNQVLHEFLSSFTTEMKEVDKTFASVFQKIYFTGSYYCDLRVATPDEFDLNLVLKLPFKATDFHVEYNPQVPSYAKYCVTNESGISKENGLAKHFENGYLIPSKIRTWMQGVVDKALKTYKVPGCISRIRPSGSGPARTIKLEKQGGGVIDIDLVPAIECSMNVKPPGIDGRVYSKVKNNLKCFLIPKQYEPTKQAPVNSLERSRLWRTHFPDAEAEIIHNNGCVKPVIKLLKLLRDQEQWKKLASYYLKTLVMWMLVENSSPEYWKEDRIGERFLDALRYLAESVKQKRIRYFFSSNCNLLDEKMSDGTATNIYHRLCNIIKIVDAADCQRLYGIFDCPP